MDFLRRRKRDVCAKEPSFARHAITDEFLIRPSWCDAALCLRLIEKGKATGHKWALILRTWLQTGLFYFGWFIQQFHILILIVGLIIFILWGFGLALIKIETNIEKLWVPRGGRLEAERKYTKSISNEKYVANNWTRAVDNAGLADDTASNYQVLIQNVRKRGDNVLTKEQLLLHVKVLENVASLSVNKYNRTWTLHDVCFKATVPRSKDGLDGILTEVTRAVLPCVMITPLDCFWEGSIPLGPFPPNNKIFGFELSWKKLNPQEVLKSLNGFLSSILDGDQIESATDLFARAGIAEAYQRRPCIDPLDPECPATSPNHIDLCGVVKNFTDWNAVSKKYQMPVIPPPTTPAPSVYDYYDSVETAKKSKNSTGAPKKPAESGGGGGLFGFLTQVDAKSPLAEKNPECGYKPYVDRVFEILRADVNLAAQLAPGSQVDYGKILTGGCRGFATKFMEWPEPLVIGEIKRDSNKKIAKAEALQTVVMLANHNDVFLRAKEAMIAANTSVPAWWSPAAAFQVLRAWQRKFSDTVYTRPENEEEPRILHPLAAASLEDMIDEFSKFNPMFIIIGYFLMIIYACLSALSFENKGVRSETSLAIAGCFIVLLANISGLGCTLILGIDFNATTTQILPFLLLSLGVDEMFLLLNNYSNLIVKLDHNEIAVLLRETGLSVLITYVNNILAFFAGILLPLPALKIFCVQVAIVLMFNLVAILTLFPAVMALDLRRQRAGRVDFLCCLRGDPVYPKSSLCIGNRPANANNETRTYYNGDTVQIGKKGNADKEAITSSLWKKLSLKHFVQNHFAPWMNNIYVKIGIVVAFGLAIAASIVGLLSVPIGLELSEIVPANTAPHSFFVARERYFPFYPIYAVVKGGFDFAPKENQRLLTNFTSQMYTSRFVVDVGSKNDWLRVMTEWLKFAQEKFDDDWAKGAFNGSDDAKPSRMGKIARQLMCSYGDKEDCEGRVGKIRLIEPDGFIREDAFYNYLTAWFNIDQMTYYVTQANFYPPPPPYDFETGGHVPPAQKFSFSQTSYFVNDINNTVLILEMIEDVRSICESSTAKGLPVFPIGIPFTFWELYLFLTQSVLIAFGIIMIAVFIAISIILLNPWISALIVTVLALMIIVELGFMGLMHIKMNPISAVTLITAVGIRVKFTVHVALSFLTHIGTRNERVTRTLEHMFIPVLHGGLSTLVGLIMLAFSKFEFIFTYYFMIMFALVILGILSGLLLMPVLLSWIGPPVEVKSFDGSSYLLPPDTARVDFELKPHPGGQTNGSDVKNSDIA